MERTRREPQLDESLTPRFDLMPPVRTQHRSAAAKPTPNKPRWLVENPADGSLLVLIPAGDFLAGGGTYHEGGCGPFRATLPAYYLALHPVTNAQYKRFLTATKRPPPSSRFDRTIWREPAAAAEAFPDDLAHHPVVGITWQDADDYCRWAGLRLPRELEWEKGSRGVDGRSFPWGDAWDVGRCQNDLSRSEELTCNVWRYPHGSSVWGCYQMSGNVWEWCADWFHPGSYRRFARGRLEEPTGTRERVVRGGSWFNTSPDNFLSAYRLGREPDVRDDHYGFRVAMDARPPRRQEVHPSPQRT